VIHLNPNPILFYFCSCPTNQIILFFLFDVASLVVYGLVFEAQQVAEGFLISWASILWGWGEFPCNLLHVFLFSCLHMN
jgi:hypothetical protein